MTNDDLERAVKRLKERVAALENEVATLERDSHPPVDLRPVIEEIVAKAISETPMRPRRYR